MPMIAAEIIPAKAPRPDMTPKAAPSGLPLDLNRLVEHWDAIVDSVGILSAPLHHATPTAVTAAGVITLTVDTTAQGELILQGEQTLINALRRRFPSANKLSVVSIGDGKIAPRRLSAEAVKADRIAMLRKQSKVLDAAVETLDLELLD